MALVIFNTPTDTVTFPAVVTDGLKVALVIESAGTVTSALPDTVTACATEVTFNVDGLTRAEPLTIGA